MSNFTGADIKKHRSSALKSGMMIGVGLGVFLIGFILNRLYVLFSNFYYLFPETALPLIIQMDKVAFSLLILGIVLMFFGSLHEFYRRRRIR